MQKEMISKTQTVCILIMFMFGSNLVMGVTTKANQDSWISLILSAVLVLPTVLMYARIMRLYPEKDLFNLMEELFGKVLGKIVVLLMTWYAVHLCALVLRNFSEFIQIVAMPETPQLPIMIAMLLCTFYIAKSGVETFGKWSLAMLPVIILIILITVVFGFENMDFSNLFPVMEHDVQTLAKGAFLVYSFPFGETVLFLCIAGSFRKKDSPYKAYTFAILISLFFLVMVLFRNILVLGPSMSGAEYFPSYITARIINIGDFFTRVEGTISINFILAGIAKISLCLFAASKGTARLFGIQDYKRMVLPVGLLALALCPILYGSTMEMFNFLDIYQFYALPFQVAIPVAVWITAEIKTRKQKKLRGKATA